MNFHRFLFFILLLFCAHGAQGAVVTFDTLPVTVEHGTFNGFMGATVDGEFYSLVCNDYDHFTEAPSGPWDYNISTLFTLTFARFGNDAAALEKYEQAALLLAGDGNTLAGFVSATTANDITAYQYALWALFTPGVDTVNNSDALLLTAYNDLSNGQDYTSTFVRLRVYTPAESAVENQEFLGLETARQTPEPGSGLLAGIGLLGVIEIGRLYNRRSDSRNSAGGDVAV